MKKYVLYYYDIDQRHEYVKKFFFLKSAYNFLHQVYIDIDDSWKRDFVTDFPYQKVKKHLKLYKQFTFIDDTIYIGKRAEVDE